MKRPAVLTTFALLFFASGFSGLIYESIWTHYLKLFLGNAAYAQTLVLAIFMGGMAAGAAWCSRRSSGLADPLLGYAAAEAAVGLAALVFHPIFTALTDLAFARVMPALGSPAISTAFKWLLGALLILPQSVLLGATFPLMTAGALRRAPERPGALIALLYFTNSLGGAIGVLVSGFVLIGSRGLPGTLRVAGVINLLVAAAVGLLAWGLPAGAAPAPAAPAPAAGTHKGKPGPALEAAGGARAWRLLLLAAGLTGLASFVYEIGWIRMLALVLGSTTHAFEMMLSAFILGLALGGWWIRGRIDRLAEPWVTLGWVQVCMGLLALATLPVYGRTFGIMDWLLDALTRTPSGYQAFQGVSHAIALVVMLPATFCAGTTLPLITAALLRRGAGEGSIGGVYAANTLGAIVAVFLAVHFGLPVLGLKGTIMLGAAVDLALGVLLLRAARGPAAGATVAAAALAIVGLVGTLLLVRLDPLAMASGIYRTGSILAPGSQVLFHRDGKTATVDLVLDGVSTSIRTNGKTDAGISLDPNDPANIDESMMILLGAMVPAFAPEARTVANIGMGSGLSTHVLLTVPTLERVDTIEIEPAMVEAARRGFAPRNSRVYSDPRSRIHIDDAKSFFSTRRSRYDAIVSEPSNPWVSGVASLFSEEFYARVIDHLADGGLFVQWLQLYEIDTAATVSVLKALVPHFADFKLYAANQGDLLIIARKGAPVGAPDPGMFAHPDLRAELERAGIAHLDDFEMRCVGWRASLEPWIRAWPAPANSDFRPYLDQRAGLTRFVGTTAKEIVALREVGLPALELLDGQPPIDADRVTRWAGLQRIVLLQSAVQVRDYLLGRIPVIADTTVADRLRQDATAFRARLAECAESAAFMDGAFRMAVALNPHLPPAQAAGLWDAILERPCMAGFGAGGQEWLRLFRAVAARDAAGMAGHGANLVRNARNLPAGPAEYALGAAMLGLIREGRRDEALALWNGFAPRLLHGPPSTVLQLLVAHAGGQWPTPA